MSLLGPLLTVLVCAWAFWKGGPAERCASGAVAITLAADLVGQALMGWGSVWSLIGADILLGLLMIACAALHPRRWLYLEVAFAAGLLLVHAFMLDGDAAMSPAYRATIDALDLLALGVLAWATFRASRRRGASEPRSP